MRVAVLAVVLAMAGCSPSAEECRTQIALANLRAEIEAIPNPPDLRRQATDAEHEARWGMEGKLSSKCIKEWREAQAKNYGLSYLSEPCRIEAKNASAVAGR